MRMRQTVSRSAVKIRMWGSRSPKSRQSSKSWQASKERRQTAAEWLATVIPKMTDEEVTEVGEKVRPSKLPTCVDELYDRLKDLRNFRTILAVGERIFSIYKHEQAGEHIAEVPELCERYDIGKTKLYEVLQGGKYKKEISTPKPESVKPARRVTTIKLGEAEETP